MALVIAIKIDNMRGLLSYRPDFSALRGFMVRLFGMRLLGRFVVLNILGIASFAGGFLVLSESRQTLATAYKESLHVQARIIAGALSQAMNDREYDSLVFSDENITDGWQVREAVRIVQRIGYVTPARVRLYSRTGQLTLDSAYVDSNSDVVARELAPIDDAAPSLWQQFIIGLRGSRPLLNEIIAADGLEIDEVRRALAGESANGERQAPDGGDILTVAVPVQGYREIVGALMVSTPPGLIDNLVRQTRQTVLEITIVAIIVSFATSLIMAATVIIPIRTLARAMRDFGRDFGKAQKPHDSIPDYSERNDEISYLSDTLRDMTTRLVKRITMIDSFAADVAHELKNPLTSLHSGVQTLAQTQDDHTRARLNQIIDYDVRRLNHLITEISRASRLDAELGMSTGDVFDLAALAEDMGAALAETYADKQKVELVVKTLPPVAPATPYAKCFVRGHQQRIAQIIDNLLSNAVSFTDAGGKVYMTIRAHSANVELIVIDEGPGIREGLETRIFERFYRDRPHKTAQKDKDTQEDNNVAAMHSGLGLSISLQIAQAYGGTLTAANRPDNVKGAVFTLTLPRLESALSDDSAHNEI